MLALVFTALLAAASTPSSVPSAMPSATPATDTEPTAPLRECVFKVSVIQRIDSDAESYAGGPYASLPGATTSSENDGSVTVDIMGKFADGGLAIKVSERMRDDPAPVIFRGEVASNGIVDFPDGSITPVSRELLPYFATSFAPASGLASGAHWTVEQSFGQLATTTDYTVTSATQTTVTIAKKQSVNAVEGASVSGNVVYEGALLVPISGQMRKRSMQMEANGQAAATLDMRFDLISDTFQKP